MGREYVYMAVLQPPIALKAGHTCSILRLPLMVMQISDLCNISFPLKCVWKFPQWNTFDLVISEAGFSAETLFKNVDKEEGKVLPALN
jgi:hypothetical protein